MGDFSLANYRRVVGSFLKERYQCLPFGKIPEKGRNCLYLRHDVDYTLQVAVKFAEVNRQLGVRGHFFVNIRSPLFNVMARENADCLRRIAALRQTIGLHYYFTPGKSRKNLKQIAADVKRDCRLLREFQESGTEDLVSWHNPSVLGDSFNEIIAAEIPGVLNVNSLMKKGVVYISDSNHRFTLKQWLRVPKLGQPWIQALFHPFQWVCGAPTMEGVLSNVWKRTIREHEEEYLTNHRYRAKFPRGLPERGLEAWVGPLLGRS